MFYVLSWCFVWCLCYYIIYYTLLYIIYYIIYYIIIHILLYLILLYYYILYIYIYYTLLYIIYYTILSSSLPLLFFPNLPPLLFFLSSPPLPILFYQPSPSSPLFFSPIPGILVGTRIRLFISHQDIPRQSSDLYSSISHPISFILYLSGVGYSYLYTLQIFPDNLTPHKVSVVCLEWCGVVLYLVRFCSGSRFLVL
jgi:hypothetical protein